MRGCLFTLLLGGVVLWFAAVVGLPAVAAGVLTAGISAAGLQADDTTVTVGTDPPTELLGLHADRVRIRATDATFRGLAIGALDVTLGNIAILDRTAGTVDGELRNVTMPAAGARGRPLALATITLSGSGGTVTASTTVGRVAAGALLGDAVAAELGVRPSAVTLSAPDLVSVRLGATVHLRLSVSAAGDLVATVLDGTEVGRSVPLVRAGDDLPIRLTVLRVTETGDLRLDGVLVGGLPG